ncbi:hypothetical protein [Cerasicoccus arenae]|nr:hypothetical protein [Cerasicoccus arenae]MBK1859222.1 hypothetical protein [Cerasicoccus arenae]
MSFLILLGLSLAALVRVELSATTSQKHLLLARQNALLGVEVAMGKLQSAMGPDQRISASPLIMDKNETLPESATISQWTGVWDAKQFNADGSDNPTYGENIGWLVSGFDQSSDANNLPSFSNPLNADGTLKTPDTHALLVGKGTVDENTYEDFVAVPKVPVGISGEYAYWIADEGRKANIQRTNRAERGESAFPGTSPIMETRFELSSPTRNNAKAITGMETLDVDTDTALAKKISRTYSAEELMLSDPNTSGGTSPWGQAVKQHYHDVTFNSLTLQTNTRQGGLKKDLSLLFELSDADFARTPYTGESTESAFSDWENLPPTDGVNYIDPVNQDQVSYLYTEAVPQHGPNAFVRGPTWHKLRDFYRLYKKVTNNSTVPQIKMRPFGPNALDLSPKGGQKGYFHTMEADWGGDIHNHPKGAQNNFVNTSVKTKSLNEIEPVTRLTEHEVMPLVNRVIYVFSLYEDQNVPEWRYVEEGQALTAGGEAPVGGAFELTGGITNAISVVVEPIVCLWNPYNVAVEFNGGIKIVSDGLFGFLFSLAPTSLTSAKQHLPPFEKSNLSIPQMTAEFSALRNIMEPGFFGKVNLVIGDGSNIILEPGEIRYFSDPNNQPTPVNELLLVNKEGNSLKTRAIKLSSGLHKKGGILLGRRGNDSNAPYSNGIIHQIKASSSELMELNFYPWQNFTKVNDGDLRSKTWQTMTTTTAYVPESALNSGGSLIETDTYIQNLFIPLNGPIDDKSNAALHYLLYGENGDSGPFPLSVRPNIIGSYPNRKMPFLYIGTFQNPVMPDPKLVPSPSEFIGTMSPFSGNVDGQFSHGGFLTTFSMQMGPISNYTDIQSLDDRGFFGEGYSSASESHVVVSEIPTYPMRSLGSLQHARIADSAYMPGQAIANAWAGGSFDLDEIVGENGARYTQYDLSYLANDALFDDYFFSTLTPEMDLSGDVPETTDLETTLVNLIDDAASQGKEISLSNESFRYIGPPEALADSAGTASSQLVENLNAIDGFSKTARYFGVAGGFNVNSLSVDAWDAFLASTLGVDYKYLDPISGYADASNADETIFPRTTLPNGLSSQAWRGPKGLSETQRRDLAQAIVNEIKERGPFLSISHFVNRKIEDTENGKAGTIQAAIDSLDINDDNLYVEAYTDPGKYFQKEHVTAFSGVGLPQYLTQADVLTPLVPYLTARSDTFVIRSYGSTINPLTKKIDAEAVLEAVVRRLPEFVNADNDSADTEISQLNDPINQEFGRRFVIVSARWLSQDEI